MTRPKLTLYFDIISPFGYFAYHVIRVSKSDLALYSSYSHPVPYTISREKNYIMQQLANSAAVYVHSTDREDTMNSTSRCGYLIWINTTSMVILLTLDAAFSRTEKRRCNIHSDPSWRDHESLRQHPSIIHQE